MEEFYYLYDDGKYYISDGKASFTIERARKFQSLDEIIKTIPIMKDYNWDYVVYKMIDGKVERVPDKIWMDMFYKWKEENPKEYSELYDIPFSFDNFIRRTD